MSFSDRQPATKPKRINVLGVPVDGVTMESALDHVNALVDGETTHTIIAVNPEKVIKARSDPKLMQHLREADLLIPDGIGVVWAARFLKLCKLTRVAGCDLMQAICERSVEKGHKLFLFGADTHVNQLATASLRQRFPGINIVGNRDGYVSENDTPQLIEEINNSGADILFIALGSPKQELWMARHADELKVKICQGVGGTFDVVGGNVKRAPKFFIKTNLEWLYRLLKEPQRIIRMGALPKFAYEVVAVKLGRKN